METPFIDEGMPDYFCTKTTLFVVWRHSISNEIPVLNSLHSWVSAYKEEACTGVHIVTNRQIGTCLFAHLVDCKSKCNLE